MSKVIKRYSNRKLYDTDESRYVTLSEVFGYVRAGLDVHIVDNATKSDVTTPILLNAVLERNKSTEVQQFTKDMLVNVITKGDGSLAGYINQTVGGIQK